MQQPLFEPDEKEAQEGDPDGLRYYQREAVEAIEKELRENRSTLVVMATGTGKTQVFSALARAWEGRVLVLAHRDELVQQARRRLEAMTGEWVEVEQAQFRSHSARIVVASIQTMQKEKRLEGFEPDAFDLIICDEAHHYTARTFRRPLDYFSRAKVLGVTATPDRTDERALGKLFDSVAYVMDIGDGIKAGYLAPPSPDCKMVSVDEIDLSAVAKSKGDLQVGQLDDAMYEGVEGIVQKTLELEPDRQCIAFFPGVRSAQYAADRFNEARPGTAICISGKTDPDERKVLVADYKRGRYQFFCNCLVATEGFDAPAASVVVQARPTLSRSMYAQMIGRVTRVLPDTVDHLIGPEFASDRRGCIAASAKPNFVILDFVGNSGKHDLMTPTDILGGNYSEAEVARAKKKAAEAGGGDPQAFLDAAREELKSMAQAMARLANEKKVKVSAHTRTFDPFQTLGIDVSKERAHAERFGFVPATVRQQEAMAKFGIPADSIKSMSKTEAGRMMDALVKRSKLGLASVKQQNLLAKWGVTQKNISRQQASKGIDFLADSGWGKKRKVSGEALLNAMRAVRQPGEEG